MILNWISEINQTFFFLTFGQVSQTVYKAITLRWLCCSKMAAMSRAGRTFLALLYDTVWLCAINQLATAESHHSPTSWLFGSPVSSADLLLWPLTYAHAHRAALSKTPPPSPWPFSEMPPMPNQIVTCLHSTAQAMHSSELDSSLFFFPWRLAFIKPDQVML